MHLLFALMKKKFSKRQRSNFKFTSVKIKVWKKKPWKSFPFEVDQVLVQPRSQGLSLYGAVRWEALGTKLVLATFERQFVFVFYRLCQACRRPFNDPAVARYPNGVTTHIHCARNKTVCPVTGHVFSSLEHRDDATDDGSWGREYW